MTDNENIDQILNPGAVMEAFEHLEKNEHVDEASAVILMAARAYADMAVEFGYESSVPNVFLATSNLIAVDLMEKARPTKQLYYRIAPQWTVMPEKPSA
jgi:hypothetical protein